MITLYTGLPRSGKSYKMVHDLHENKDKYFVIHNIDGLKKGYLGEYGFDFVEYCEKENIEIIEFFSKEFQIKLDEAIHEKYKRDCLIIIDESQEWFDRNKKQLKMWLSYHGHLNQTVWMVTHRASNLSSVYRSYVETEYRAKHGSMFNIPGIFVYNRISGGTPCGYAYVRKKQKIFDLYKSQNNKYVKRKPSYFIPVMFLLVVLGVVMFFWMPSKIIKKSKKNEVSEKKIEKKDEVTNTSNNNKNDVVNEQYRYAGEIGDDVLIQDLRTGETIFLKYLDGLVYLKKYKDRVRVYDVKAKKEIDILKHIASAKARTTQEAGLLQR